MSSWFTTEIIDKDTFVISEYQHWEETHCYLLCGTKKAILIDTGLGVANIKKVVDSLTSLPVTAITTHIHWDHIGGHKYFDTIAVHEAEKDWLSGRFPIPLQVVKRNLMRKPCDFPSDFKIEKYQIFQGVPQIILHDKDCIDLGNRKLIVLHTPGHSPGHCCFYEPEREYLYSGDLIYKGCLDAFYPTTDPQLFFQSIRKLQSLEIQRILPAHHQLAIPVDIISRIEKAFCQLTNQGMGKAIYVFEVQSKGSIDSLILNLKKAQSNAAVQAVVAVADEEQLAKIIQESAGVIDEKSLRTWDSEDVLAVYDALVRAHESINKLALVPESF